MADFNKWSRVADALPDVLGQIVSDTAIAAVANIAGVINNNGQVVTGAMRGNIYYTTSERSTYGQGQAPTSPGSYLLPEHARPSDKTTAYISAAANYSIYQDMGTRFMAARPFFEPGIERTRPYFEQQLGTLDTKLAEAIR